jgi:hypothetical protein
VWATYKILSQKISKNQKTNQINKNIKKMSISFVIMGLQIKITRYHYAFMRMTKIPNTTPNTGRNVEK